MPNWKKIIRDVAQTVEEASREANARQRASLSGPVGSKGPTGQKRCQFWDCGKPIKPDHFLCFDHYSEMTDGLVDECPGCKRAKYVEYDCCLDCFHDKPKRRVQTKPTVSRGVNKGPSNANHNRYKPEYSPAWDKGDQYATEFFVYILKLDGGKFYAGQTRELRERMDEHRDGRTKSTAGQNPKLVWFTTLPTRDAAAKMEVDLKRHVDTNPREIRRMVIGFKDLIRELDYSNVDI